MQGEKKVISKGLYIFFLATVAKEKEIINWLPPPIAVCFK